MPISINKYRFKIIIEGITCAYFSEVSAADLTTGPIEYREGANPAKTVSKMPGLSKYGPITLKWGLSTDKTFTDWVTKISAGTVERKEIMIQAMDDRNQQDMATWVINNAWPSKHTAPDFQADADETIFESIELAHEGIKRIN